ncbi:MAG TPA: hypothetical protein VN769_06920 [Xanthobacteraceae bacterium]|nr:hypothetical protein [Xanthobacteraceae bacterium]
MNRGQIILIGKHYCPSCGRSMRLASTVPRFGAFPELRTFECKTCGVTYTEAAKPDDEGEAVEPSQPLTPR